jgi:hypothetical protein
MVSSNELHEVLEPYRETDYKGGVLPSDRIVAAKSDGRFVAPTVLLEGTPWSCSVALKAEEMPAFLRTRAGQYRAQGLDVVVMRREPAAPTLSAGPSTARRGVNWPLTR